MSDEAAEMHSSLSSFILHPSSSPAVSRWKTFRHRLERRALELAARAVPRLSRARCVQLGRILGELAFVLDRRGRAVARANLECVFGKSLPPRERDALARASYRNFVRTMLDLFWARNLTQENHSAWLKLEGFDALRERHARSPGGSILFCVHQGNWEWASLAFGFAGLPTIIVAENFKNPLLTDTFDELRELSGHRIIPQESSMLRLLKTVKRGGSTGLLLDLNLRPSKAATVIEAFGRPGLQMCVTFLHALLAQRASTLLFPVETLPQPDGTCRVIAHPPVEWPAGASVQEIAQRCWAAMEPLILARPGEWLWPYKHFRYRPSDATRAYPFYAHQSAKFEKLLRTVLPPSAARPGAKHSTEF
jgi:KDO2-lipid IV(A) lauroyltransferase